LKQFTTKRRTSTSRKLWPGASEKDKGRTNPDTPV
jgi:hypothetical protein